MAQPPINSPTRIAPIVLAVIDGWGIAPQWGGNAVSLAKTPFMNMAGKTYPHAELQASGPAVGLPENERGNSEVGHLNIGAGQIVHQSFPSITAAIKDGTFYKSPALIDAFSRAQKNNKAVHIMGLCSDGGIHSHIDHLYALLEMGKQLGSTNIVIHAITDGRDTPPFAAQEHLSHISTALKKYGFGRFGTVSGRYYAMDRDHRWERIERVYRAITEGVGKTAPSAEGAVALAYRDGFSDEYVEPTVIQGEQNSFQPLQDGDSFIFFNFRGDRAREITQALVKQDDFKGFRRKKVVKDLLFVGFTFYQEGLPMEVAFSPREVKKPLSAVLSEAGLTQLHVAESEKYAHVTYFFNGGQEGAVSGEERIVIPSPKASSYDRIPEMATDEIVKTVVKNIKKYDFIILNFACPDMVGHTGNLRATIKACEAVDRGLKKIYEEVKALGGLLVVTADHGNAEQMVNPKTGEPDTEHSNNPVPLVLAGDPAVTYSLSPKGSLEDVAPTILAILGLKPSAEMTGKNLVQQKEAATPAASS